MGRMRGLRPIVGALAVAAAVAAPALAADLRGRYQGTGRGRDTVLEMSQIGDVVHGRFRFPDGATGVLAGRAHGTVATGTITVPAIGTARFRADLLPEGLRLRIVEPGRVTQAMFVPVPPPAPAVPETPQGTVRFFLQQNGVAVGPYTAAQMLEKHRTGALAADQPVRRSDSSRWQPAASVPELRAAFPRPGGDAPASPEP
ncbi:MAG: DUF4339 domain-containing protein [Rhodospirillaceae bacterium]|nr:DUF4339 domain-containing protein [Rhodospirillaceae bacterium]